MASLQDILCSLQASPIRLLLRPLETTLRRIIFNRSRIISGPTRGLYFPHIWGTGALLGTYELHVHKAIQKCLTKGDIFYDIGAHHGYFSSLASVLVASQGHVYAFEPLPENAKIINYTMYRNQVTNYTLIQAAVSCKSGTGNLYLGDNRTARPSLFQWRGENKIEVNTITLNAFVRDNPWPTAIIVDVEGAETLILEGASDLLVSQTAPDWIIETHSVEIDLTVKQLLEAQNYQLQDLDPHEGRRKPYPRHLFARKNTPH